MRRKGRILKRGKRSWAVVLYMGRDPETKKEKRRWYTFHTQQDAEQFLHQCLASGPGAAPPNRRIRLGEYLEQWLTDYAAGAVAPTTLASYRDTVRVHLAPAKSPAALGLTPLVRLTPQAIQGYLTEKLKSGLSPETIRRHYVLLHEALRHAVKWGLLTRNPADSVSQPPRRQVEMRVWDEEQARLFLAEAKRSSAHYRLYLAALMTGMRQGELLGLRWQDVDLVLNCASIQQIFYRLSGSKKDARPGQQLFKEPKSSRARRLVALAPALVEELRSSQGEQREQRRLFGRAYHDHGLVFCQADGEPLNAKNIVRRDFRRVMKRARVPRIRFHDLRHCHATLLLRQGVNLKVIQERLGHSTAALTLQIYSHVLPGMQEQAAQLIAERLLGGPAVALGANLPEAK